MAEVMTLDKIKNEIELTCLRKTRCSNKVFTYTVEDKSWIQHWQVICKLNGQVGHCGVRFADTTLIMEAE